MLYLKTLCAGLVIAGLCSSPSLAGPIDPMKDMTLDQLLIGTGTKANPQFSAANDNLTIIKEAKDELVREPFGFTIRGGGAAYPL